MADLIYVLIIVVFFAIAAVFVAACDRVIGREDLAASIDVGEPEPEQEVAA